MALAAQPQTEPRRKRVLIVDDSVVVRGLFARWLGEGGAYDVLPSAANGRSALELAERHRPDIVILDLDMPVMDGIEALPHLLQKVPGCAVLVASTLTRRNADLAMRCLTLGATDVLAKPESNRDLTLSTSFRNELMQRLEALAAARTRRPPAAKPRVAPEPETGGNIPVAALAHDLSGVIAGRPRTLLIGASTGGPRAISRVLFDMRAALPQIATVIVQHMPPLFTASFADQLASQVGVPAREAAQHDPIEPGRILIAPGGIHLGLRQKAGRAVAHLDDAPPVRFCKPAVDVLFRDAAEVLGPAALGLVLTGMGRDGADGAEALRAAGASILVQDEESSVVWGMPGAIAKAGHAAAVLPAAEIGPALRAFFLKEDRQ